MESTINMQDMRYLNLFEKITRVSTRYCFKYNEILMFAVPRNLISKALGKNNENLKKLSGILKKRIRVVPIPKKSSDAKIFIESIISPLDFKSLEIFDNELILTAGSQNKAALIGRNKRRLEEMKKIIKSFFGLEYKIA